MIDDEIRNALNVEPSPGFLARGHERGSRTSRTVSVALVVAPPPAIAMAAAAVAIITSDADTNAGAFGASGGAGPQSCGPALSAATCHAAAAACAWRSDARPPSRHAPQLRRRRSCST